MTDVRKEQLTQFAEHSLGTLEGALQSVSGDASFRRYFRGRHQGEPFIAVDAPPERENGLAFLALADALLQQGIMVPRVLCRSQEQGFWLLQDFGDQLLLPLLNEHSVHRWYGLAIDELLRLQNINVISEYALPDYDALRLQVELQLFPDWFLQRHLQHRMTAHEQQILQQVFAVLLCNAGEQPQVFVHRDYHSRNLMILESSSRLGVIDFQDAVWGPITYDLVSLLKDCYIQWPRSLVLAFVELYWRKQVRLHNSDISREQFIRWFDLMGLQRHLKVLGIFCRLNYRDNKPQYLQDLPRVLRYVVDCACAYEDTEALGQWLQNALAEPLANAGLALP